MFQYIGLLSFSNIDCIIVNSTDPDQMSHSLASQLGQTVCQCEMQFTDKMITFFTAEISFSYSHLYLFHLSKRCSDVHWVNPS